MELFWMIAGIAMLVYAIYAHVNDLQVDEIKYFYMAGSMGVILSIFRMIYRKNVIERQDDSKNK
jgi:hypothetical protein